MTKIYELQQYKHIHMLGIGGVSMSGIAELLKHWGFSVTGSDRTSSPITDKLISNGIPVTIGNDDSNLINSNLVVYTAAIKQDDVLLLRAKALGIPTIERASFLGTITKAFEDTICISGTHGKTTTTSMVSMCFLEAAKDPSIQVGAYLKAIDGNYRVGNSEYFIIEACEYVESFLKFFPKSEIILNIDNDHLDYFKNLENIKTSFAKYVALLPEDGLLVLNGDDINCKGLNKFTSAKCLTYGIENESNNFIARNISFNKNGFPTFDVYFNNNFYKTINLSIPGSHNIMNALACIALCHHYEIPKDDIKSALAKYTGASRRFEFKGEFNGVSVYDDYAHHPTEIVSIVNALKNKDFNKSWVIFQPHTYSRTYNLLNDFAEALSNFDNIIVTDIYSARENNIYNISSQDLVSKLISLNPNTKYMSDFEHIASYIKSNAKPSDIVITLGAGTITNLSSMLVE